MTDTTDPAADDLTGPAAGPQIDAEATEHTTGADDTGTAFAAAFGPPGDDEPTAMDYDAWVAEYGDGEQDDDPDVDSYTEAEAAEAAWADLVAVREQIAQERGLPENLWPRVMGGTEEEIQADVAQLLTLTGHTGPPEADDDDTENPSGNAEAARYRHRLREAKGDLAAMQDTLGSLQERVDVMHRASAETIASGPLVEGADLWRDGATVADIRGPSGDVDEAKVRALADAVIKAHPHAARASRSVWGRYSSGATSPPAENPSPAWPQAFAPRKG